VLSCFFFWSCNVRNTKYFMMMMSESQTPHQGMAWTGEIDKTAMQPTHCRILLQPINVHCSRWLGHAVCCNAIYPPPRSDSNISISLLALFHAANLRIVLGKTQQATASSRQHAVVEPVEVSVFQPTWHSSITTGHCWRPPICFCWLYGLEQSPWIRHICSTRVST